MEKMSKKRCAVYLAILAAVVYCTACILYPEHSEQVARGFSVFFNAIILILGV